MGRSILLIDDHEDSLVVYRTVLEFHGYVVFIARTPDEGIALARESSPDVIVTELFRRTDSGGWYTPEALRRDPRTQSVPIVALSTSCLPEDRQRAEKSGCTHFLAKPITPSSLAQAISVLTDLPAELSPSPAG